MKNTPGVTPHFPIDRTLPDEFPLPGLNIRPTQQTVPQENFLQLLRIIDGEIHELINHPVTSNILLGEQSGAQSGAGPGLR